MAANATTKIEVNATSTSENIRIFESQQQQAAGAQEEFVKSKTNEIEAVSICGTQLVLLQLTFCLVLRPLQ